MNSLGIPQDRIAKRADVNQVLIHNHLLKMIVLPKLSDFEAEPHFMMQNILLKEQF